MKPQNLGNILVHDAAQVNNWFAGGNNDLEE
jgi:hypothetical protein